jgi:phosphopantothenoylcysteine decarboxylase/phosphopantothenate--cysteine ligase
MTIVLEPVNGVEVTCFSIFGLLGLSRSTVKLWIDDRSLITNWYLPALSLLTGLPAFFSEIVKPGPTTPFSVGVLELRLSAVALNTRAATAKAARIARWFRFIPLLSMTPKVRRRDYRGFTPSGHNVEVARVLLGVTGGIAAYKACELTRLLLRAGHEVTPIVTPEAERFVTAQTFEALARREMPRELYPHLAEADLLVIAPLSANTLAKLAQGLADNVLTQTALAFGGPVLAAPAMNPRMWSHPATQANVETLQSRGVELVGPEHGDTAEGEVGLGRMSEPGEIFERCVSRLGKGSQLRGLRVLVTAGGTREPLDAVRFLGNRSSGRMGAALAAEARRRGADVTLVASNLSVLPPVGMDVVSAPTADDLARETLARSDADVVLMAAAVADYRPAERVEAKRPKDGQTWRLELEPTVDVLQSLGARRTNGQVLVGFAAETGDGGLTRARKKLNRKGVDLVVYNDVARDDIGFDADENEVVLVTADGQRRVGKAPKDRIAVAIVDTAEELLRERAG